MQEKARQPYLPVFAEYMAKNNPEKARMVSATKLFGLWTILYAAILSAPMVIGKPEFTPNDPDQVFFYSMVAVLGIPASLIGGIALLTPRETVRFLRQQSANVKNRLCF